MTKRKYVVLIVILVLALALTAFCLWYTRPMTFDHLSPEVDLPACQEIRVDATYHNASHDRDEYELTISPDDPAFDQLLSLLEHQTYRRSMRNLLPQTSRTVSLQPGDFQWHIILEYEEAVLFPDGTWEKERFCNSIASMMEPSTSPLPEIIGKPLYQNRSNGCLISCSSFWTHECLPVLQNNPYFIKITILFGVDYYGSIPYPHLR